jgi:hypothetical protein
MHLHLLKVGDSVRYNKFDWVVTYINQEAELLILNNAMVVTSGKDIMPSSYWKQVDEYTWDLHFDSEIVVGKLEETVSGYRYCFGLDDLHNENYTHYPAGESEETKRQVLKLYWEWLGR